MQTFEKGQKILFKGGHIPETGEADYYEPQEVIYIKDDPQDQDNILSHFVQFSDGEKWWVSDDQLSAEIPVEGEGLL